MFTKTYEPVRPLRAPENSSAYFYRSVFGEPRVDYGSCEWPSRSYWLVPNNENNEEVSG
jgi:hypothetical protein